MDKKISLHEIENIIAGCTYEQMQEKRKHFADDGRKSVVELFDKYERKHQKAMKEMQEYNKRCVYENKLYSKGVEYIAGVDEVGRGPLAGPVYCAAVILDPDKPILGIKDSKKLSHNQREKLSVEIQSKAVAWALGSASQEEIDNLNILNATKLAMKRALMALSIIPQHVLIDALTIENLPYEQTPIIKGDDLSVSIGAASIIAKVARDTLMVKMSKIYPEYGFDSNKGYGTEEHIKAIKKYGPCEIHRKTFIKNFV